MPPTSKKFRGCIGFGLSVHMSLRVSVMLCIRSRMVRDLEI